MEKPDIFMPLYIGDYLAGTSRLTTELHGAYLLLIMDYWMNGPLPDDDDALASIAKMTPDAWSIARAKLEKYFSISDGVWKQKRIEEELAAAMEKKQKAREKAKKAASVRWNNASGNAPSNASGELEDCPSPPPPPPPPPSGKNKPPISPKGDDVDFSVWPQMPSDQTMKDWQAMRKKKKAAVSQTVINRMAAELEKAVKAGYTVDECLQECVLRNWQGFKLEWMSGSMFGSQPSQPPVKTRKDFPFGS